MDSAVQVTMYLNEGDPWDKVLQFLHDEHVAGASALHAVAGFNGRDSVRHARLVEAGGNLPVIIIFVDLEEHVQRVLPQLFSIVPHRLIVREKVQIEQGSLD